MQNPWFTGTCSYPGRKCHVTRWYTNVITALYESDAKTLSIVRCRYEVEMFSNWIRSFCGLRAPYQAHHGSVVSFFGYIVTPPVLCNRMHRYMYNILYILLPGIWSVTFFKHLIFWIRRYTRLRFQQQLVLAKHASDAYGHPHTAHTMYMCM